MKSLIPVCVDLDGALLRTDMLLEGMIQLVKKNLFYLYKFLIWRMRGKAFLKMKVAKHAAIKTEFLPYNQKVLDYIREVRLKNHPVILATGSHITCAQQIADHLGCFERVFASDGVTNLTHQNKLFLLVQTYGKRGFIYIGNSRADIPIWEAAEEAFFVNTPQSVQKKVKKVNASWSVLDQNSIHVRLIFKQFRIYQWVKNSLLLVPLITAHNFLSFFQILVAFFSFSFLASAIYVMNDLFDLEADRQHPTKKHRPLASGALSIHSGIASVVLLIPLSFYLAFFLPPLFLLVLFTYFVVNLAYNLVLKSKAIIDVLCLAFLYLLRILGGHAVTGIPLSRWLTTFALFFFLSLALIKRYTEFTTQESHSGRGYQLSDANFIGTLGLTSSAISILVFTLYLNSEQVATIYRFPEYLWVSIPLLFYWISRLWLKAFRLQMHEDPIVFALKDPISHWLAVSLLLVILFSKG